MSIHQMISPLKRFVPVLEMESARRMTLHAFAVIPEEYKGGFSRPLHMDELVLRAREVAYAGKLNQRKYTIYASNVRADSVVDHPEYGEPLQYVGSSVFDLDYAFGFNELVDYALFECAVQGDSGIPMLSEWRNRFNETANYKAPHSYGWRYHASCSTMGDVYFPFKDGTDFHNTRIEILSAKPLMLIGCEELRGEPVHDDAIPEDGMFWQQYFWHVQGQKDANVRAGQMASIPCELHWNNGKLNLKPDEPLCEVNTSIYVDSDCGYLPRRKISVVNGKFNLDVAALGLREGETIRAKFSSRCYSSITTLEIPVV